jgi:LPXTG-motif cell wall-anchored protein
VSVAASAYGVGRLVTGHGAHDIAILIVGLGAGALGAIVAVRRHRRRTARRLAAVADGPPREAP